MSINTRSYEYGRQKVADDYVDDEFSYQEYDFQGAAGFSFGGVKADVIDYESDDSDDEDDDEDDIDEDIDEDELLEEVRQLQLDNEKAGTS